MEKIIIMLITSPFMFFMVFLSFIIAIVFTLNRRNKRKVKRDILDIKTMLMESDVTLRVPLITFGLVFIIFGLVVIYAGLKTTDILGNKITACIFGGIMIIVPILIITNSFKQRMKIKMGKYIITIDTLLDKYYYNDHNSNPDSVDHSRWQLYFKDFYKKYNKYVILKDLRYGDKINIGEQFYLVFISGSSQPNIYSLNEYTLSDNEKSKLIKLEDAKDFIKLKEFKIENEIKEEKIIDQKEKIIINKKKIENDFFDKKEKQTLLFSICSTLFCLLFLIMVLLNILDFPISTLIISVILISIMLLFFLFMTIVKIKYLFSVVKNIKKNNFKVKKDKVISLNNLVQFKDSNHIISFKFNDYKKIVFEDKKNYLGTEIGDEFYLIFVKGEKEPIKVYRVKDSILDNISIDN